MKDNLITHINKFVTLSEADAEKVRESIGLISVKKKQWIFEPGDVCKSNYFVNKGCMRLYFINRNGQEQIIQFGIENWWITDYGSWETMKQSNYYLQAIEDAEIISINKKAYNDLLLAVPAMERYFRIILQTVHAANMRRFEYIRDQTDEERYRDFVGKFPGFAQRIPQYMMASYLGFTPQFLSKIRGKREPRDKSQESR